MTTDMNSYRNMSSCILMFMITEECDHNKYTNNDESNNINNDKMIVVSTIRSAIVI